MIDTLFWLVLVPAAVILAICSIAVLLVGVAARLARR